MEETNKSKHIIYSRKSKYTCKGESIENQVDLCKQKLLVKYQNINEEDILVFTDEGFTGANTKRPAFQKMMNYIRTNSIKSVTCYRLDRISRNVGDFCNLINELQKYNVGFISIREDFDTTSPMGKAMMLICSVFAQLERDTIAERIKDNMLELAKTGRWLGGTPPTGFKSKEISQITYDGKKKKLYKLESVLEEKKIVVLLKNKYREIKSQTGLETYTIQNNLKTKNGKKFTRWSLVNILSNPVYSNADKESFDYFSKKGAIIINEEKEFDGTYGLMVYNKTNQKTGSVKKNNPIQEWIVAIGKHKGFWSGREYVEIQKLLALGANKRFRKPALNNALLSGILKCSYCNNFMRPKLYKNIDKNDTIRFSYLCELKDKSRKVKCNHKNLNGNIADKQILNFIYNLPNQKHEFFLALKDLAKCQLNNLDNKLSEFIILSNEIKKNENEINILVDRIKQVPIDIVPELASEIQRLKKITTDLKKQIELLNFNKTTIDEAENQKLALNIMNSYIYHFTDLDLLQKRILIKLLISSVYSDGENLFINLTGTHENSKLTKIPTSEDCK